MADPSWGSAKTIDSNFCVMGAVDEKILVKVAAEGYKSVLNVRRPAEANLEKEAELCQAKSLSYASSPITASADGIDAKAVKEAVEALHKLPKPVFVHCASGGRASLVALMYKHTHEKPFASLNDVIGAAAQAGFVYNDNWRKIIQDELLN